MISQSYGSGACRLHFVLLALLAAGLAPLAGAARRTPLAGAAPSASTAVNDVGEQAARRTLAAMPLVFEENMGQAPDQIRFLARGGGYALGLSGLETTLSLRNSGSRQRHRGRGEERITERDGGIAGKRDSGIERFRSTPSSNPLPSSLRPLRLGGESSGRTTVKTRLIGANPHANSRGEKRLAAKINYFLGDDPKKWQTDVPAYERVRTAGVYPGIDVVHYGQQGGALEYDFVLAPGADPGDIRFAVQGAERAALAANGDLVLTVPGGELRQQKPVCY